MSSDTQINHEITVDGSVTIGSFVKIAPNVMLAGGCHGYDDLSVPMRFQHSSSKGGIGDDVWIGANSTILDCVTIGKDAIITAELVVRTNVNAYEIVVQTKK